MGFVSAGFNLGLEYQRFGCMASELFGEGFRGQGYGLSSGAINHLEGRVLIKHV